MLKLFVESSLSAKHIIRGVKDFPLLQEIMGLLVGSVEGSRVTFRTLKVLKRLTKEKDRVEIDNDQLIAASDFAASLKVKKAPVYSSNKLNKDKTGFLKLLNWSKMTLFT